MKTIDNFWNNFQLDFFRIFLQHTVRVESKLRSVFLSLFCGILQKFSHETGSNIKLQNRLYFGVENCIRIPRPFQVSIKGLHFRLTSDFYGLVKIPNCAQLILTSQCNGLKSIPLQVSGARQYTKNSYGDLTPFLA